MFRRIGLLLLSISVAPTALAAPREAVLDAFDAVLAAGHYRVEVTTVTGKREHVMQLDVMFPNRFHLRSPESEMILLPGGTWMRVEQEWMRMPVDMSKTVEAYTDRAIQQARRSIADVTQIAEGEVAGCDSLTYAYRQTGEFMGKQADGLVEMSICKDSGLPSQIVTRSGTERKPTVVTSVYDFSAEIRIEAP